MTTSRRQFITVLSFFGFAWNLISCREVTIEVSEDDPSPTPSPTPGATNTQGQTDGLSSSAPSTVGGVTPPPTQDGVTPPTLSPTQPPSSGGVTPPQTNPTPPPNTNGATVVMQDLVMEGWSTLGSGFLGNNGSLKATMIRDNRQVTLNYIQDSHGHRFTLTPDHFLKLRQGKAIEVITTEMLGHKHIVKINPAKVVNGSVKITMPVVIP